MNNPLIYPIVAAILWAVTNYIDKYLLNKFCKNREIGGLVIFSGLIGLPVLITIGLIQKQNIFLPLEITLALTFAGAIYILGIVPYLYALEQDETSTVSPQSLTIPAFTAILSYIFLNEILTNNEIIGSGILIAGALFLSIEKPSQLLKLKLQSKTFKLMMASSALIATYTFLFKFLSIETNFWVTAFWIHVGFFIITILFFIFIKPYREQFITLITMNRKGIIGVNIMSEIITVTGNLSFHYGSLLMPLAIAETIAEGTQPFFVLTIGIILTILFPNIIKENVSRKHILKKVFSVTIMVYGLYLITIS